MNYDVKPTLVVSRCLGFNSCTYNGQMSNLSFMDKLMPYVNIITVCPECDIGMEIPRDTIRIIRKNDKLLLIQPSTEKDFTYNMQEFTKNFIKNIGLVDGFILKNRSPSCGIKDVKIYDSPNKGANSTKGRGFFGGEIKDNFSLSAIEDDGRLKDFNIRNFFFTKLFLIGKFNKVKNSNNPTNIKDFHYTNRLLLSVYNNKELKILENILNSMDKLNISDLIEEYEVHLSLATLKAPRYTSIVKALNESLNSIHDEISKKEYDFISTSIAKYEKSMIPSSVPINLIKCSAIRLNKNELLDQSFFSPYPEQLLEVRDSGKVVN